MSNLPNPSTLVQQSKIYGSVNPGNLYLLMKNASGNNVNRWYLIRDSVKPLLRVNEMRDVDNIYKGDNPFNKPVNTSSNVPTPTLVAPISTTPSDANISFPAPDSSKIQLDAFYQSAAYQDYIGQRMAQTAGPGFDWAFNAYVLNNVLSYESNRNIQGGMSYIYSIDATRQNRLADALKDGLAIKNISLTQGEAKQVLAGMTLTLVSGPNGVMMTPNQASGDIIVDGVTSANTSNYLPTLGVISMLASGLAFIPSPITNGPDINPNTNNRAATSSERAFLNSLANWKNPAKIVLRFGPSWNIIADVPIMLNRAQTQGNSIFIPGEPRDMSILPADRALLAHEYYHSVQYDTLGVPGFVARWTIESIQIPNTYNYWERELYFAHETLEGQSQIIQDYVRYTEENWLRSGVSVSRLESMVAGSGLYGK